EELRGGYTLPNEAPSSELARYSNEIRFSVFGQFLLDDARVRNSGPQSEPAVLLDQQLGLVGDMARSPLQNRRHPERAGTAQRGESRTGPGHQKVCTFRHVANGMPLVMRVQFRIRVPLTTQKGGEARKTAPYYLIRQHALDAISGNAEPGRAEEGVGRDEPLKEPAPLELGCQLEGME